MTNTISSVHRAKNCVLIRPQARSRRTSDARSTTPNDAAFQQAIDDLLLGSTLLPVGDVLYLRPMMDFYGRIGFVAVPAVLGFQMLDELGRGGMGGDRQARPLSLGRDVALSAVPPSTKEEEQEYRRFKQEAILLATLGHANIVKVFDIGEADGRPYFVMELVGGESLAARLGGNPRPPTMPRKQSRRSPRLSRPRTSKR